MFWCIIISASLQITAAVLALRLVAVTGRRLGWISIAIGLSLMAYRRLVVLHDLYTGAVMPEQIAFPETVAVVLSAFLCLGVATIQPYFKSLNENYRLRLESETKYRAVADMTYDWEYWLDRNLEYVYVSPSCQRFCGLSRDELIAQPSLINDVFDHRDSEVYLESIKIVIDKREAVHNVLKVKHRDGRSLVVDHVAHPAFVDGEFYGIRGSFSDITEAEAAKEEVVRLNQDLEKRVQIRTSQLLDVNSDLEAFIYSISHDLRAPLRHLNGYAEILATDYSSDLNNEGREILSRITYASKEMNALIDALLRLSRVARKDLLPEEINASEIALSLASDYVRQARDRDLVIDIAPDIWVFADSALLQDILHNLIENSVKFCQNKPQTVISMSPIRSEGMSGFTFIDNGVGFREDQKDKLFKVFSRLHSEDIYKGTGIGLATVHRIVQRHGGRISAESEEGESCRINILLPDKSASPV